MILDGSSLDSSADSDDSGTFDLKIVLVTPSNLVERTINSSRRAAQMLVMSRSFFNTELYCSPSTPICQLPYPQQP
jgi:hypothetical protein